MFHSNPWCHLRVNLETGEFEEAPNPCPTPESLYRLVSVDYVQEYFGNHPVIQLRAMMDRIADVPRQAIENLAEWANYDFDFTDTQTQAASARALFDIMAYRSTLYVLDKLVEFVPQQNSKLLVLLTHGRGKVQRYLGGGPKSEHDQSVIRRLEAHGIGYLDALDLHKQDYAQFRATPHEYAQRYYIGHYNPMGNHFFAYAIKDAVVAWLDPKPVAYQGRGSIIDFRHLEK